MAYIDGFIIPVHSNSKLAYLEFAQKAAAIFIEYGANRVMESLGEDIKAGKTNDFRTAIIAQDQEEVVFSWIEWPSKEVRDAGTHKAMNDPRMQIDGAFPSAAERLIYGGGCTHFRCQCKKGGT